MLESRNFTIIHVAEFDRGREETLPCYEDSQFLRNLMSISMPLKITR